MEMANTERLQEEEEEEEEQEQEEKRIPSHPHLGTRCHDPNPAYPTTFVRADTSTFKHIVQMLTGSSTNTIRTRSTPQKKQGFKLYERRNSLKNGLIIDTLAAGARNPEILSPSILDFPSLVLSPATPANSSPLADQEEKAIAEKKFYLHPSPRTTPRDGAEPRLLPLFPLTSPRT